jgi:general secretion pathway protein K
LTSKFARIRRSAKAAGAGERGLALLTVLWVLSLLSVIAAGLVTQTSTELQITRNMTETARARGLAEAGVFLAIPRLLDPSPETQWRPNGEERSFEYGGGAIRIVLQDEGGKIDLNAAPNAILAGLFGVLGIGADETSRLVDAIADWKDEDGPRRPNGAKRDDYRRAGLTWVPRNGPFEAIEELRLVLGMTPALYNRLLPFITIYSQSARINPSTASSVVLRALPGANAEEIARLLVARARSETALPIPTGLDQFLSPGAARAVTIRSEGRTPGGGLFVREAVVDITGNLENPYVFLAWRQGRSPEATDEKPSPDEF